MGLLSRVTQVMSDSFNALLDKADDPKKELDQTLRDMQDQIAAARRETVEALGAEKQLEKRLAELDVEIDKWSTRAELAVKSDDDLLAREALVHKRRLVAERDRGEADRAERRASAVEMKELLARMEQQHKLFERRRSTIATRARQERAGGGPEGLGYVGPGPNNFEQFRRMEQKVEDAEHQRLGEREVARALEVESGNRLSTSELEAKFRALEATSKSTSSQTELDQELQALKAKVRIAT